MGESILELLSQWSATLCCSFWWSDVMKMVDKYMAVCISKAGKGDSILFWHDYLNSLHSFALDSQLSVQEVILYPNRASLFYRPLSQQDFEEYNMMEVFVNSVVLDPTKKDIWSTIWKDGIYSANC
jgi:hypothetical protein